MTLEHEVAGWRERALRAEAELSTVIARHERHECTLRENGISSHTEAIARIASLEQENERLENELKLADEANYKHSEANRLLEQEIERLIYPLGQLRHAYTHLISGTVGDYKKFANGLISPAIKAIEATLPQKEGE